MVAQKLVVLISSLSVNIISLGIYKKEGLRLQPLFLLKTYKDKMLTEVLKYDKINLLI